MLMYHTYTYNVDPELMKCVTYYKNIWPLYNNYVFVYSDPWFKQWLSFIIIEIYNKDILFVLQNLKINERVIDQN